VRLIETLSHGQDRKVPAEEKKGTATGMDSGNGEKPAVTGTAGAESAPAPVRGATKLVERATALRGQSIARPRTPKSTLRRRTLQDLRDRDLEVPYRQYEAASRDLICSLMERQDRMNEEIFNRIIDLEYRMNELEDKPAPVRAGRKNNGPEG
jgi:hypothetical protein